MTDDKFICPKTDICLRQDQSAISCEHCKPHNWNLVCDKHGERYCPCRIRSGDTEKDRLIICPCAYHEDEIENEGHCHCNLFFLPGE